MDRWMTSAMNHDQNGQLDDRIDVSFPCIIHPTAVCKFSLSLPVENMHACRNEHPLLIFRVFIRLLTEPPNTSYQIKQQP